MQGGEDGNRNRQQQNQNLNIHHDQQPCPRCDSTNTKFCYYNNYSLAQPRYFCKTCRRYWTQGGTLRNIPVGGVRKNKRPRPSSSEALASSSYAPPPPLQLQLQQPPPPPVLPHLNFPNPQVALLSNPIMNPPPSISISSMGSNYYPGSGSSGGFFPSLPFNNNQQPLDHPLNIADHHMDGGSAASNLGLLQGFTSNPTTAPSFGNVNPMLMNASHQNRWNHPGFINSTTTNPNPRVSNTASWSLASTSSSDSSSSGSLPGGSNLNPNPWPHLPGFGPPDQ